MPTSTYTAPDPASSALLTIDMQRDFSVSGRSGYVQGTEEIITPIRRVLDAFRAHERPIVHVVRLYQPDGSNVDACRREEIESGKRVVAPGTAGAELVDDLHPSPDASLRAKTLLDGQFQRLADREWAMYKPRWGAFFQTHLHQFLQERNLDTAVITGCNFPNCPRATVYEGSERDYRIVMIPQAVSGTYERGLRELKRIGVRLMSVADCEDWLDRSREPQPPADSQHQA